MKTAQKIALNIVRARLNLLAVVSRKRAAARAFDLFCTPKRIKRKIPEIFHRAEKVHFSLEGINVNGYHWCPEGHKRLLILHGFESASTNFERYILPLTRLGYEVFAFDAPGHGQSGGRQINLPLYISMIRGASEKFGPFDAFLSHSFGGLALTHFLESGGSGKKIKAALIAPATETTTAINSFFKLLQLNEEVKKEFNQIIFNKSGVWPQHFSIRRAMHHIQARVLWIHDENDTMTPIEDAIRVRDDRHEQLEFFITRGLGHRRIYRDNQVRKKIIDFFSENPGSQTRQHPGHK